ncbi:MAG TPA: CHASE3 domain-containing protein [Opitutaceae bacterium]|nr:CHASE3 domain-containing protein [Opitutaceae bacterium]
MERRITLGFVVALGVLLAMAVAATYAVRAFNSTNASVRRTEAVRREMMELVLVLQDVEIGSRGYILTGQEQFVEPFERGAAKVRQALPELRHLTVDDPHARERLDRMAPLIAQRVEHAAQGIALRRSGATAAAVAHVATGEGKSLMDEIRRLFDELRQREDRRLDERLAAVRRTATWTTTALALGLTIDFVLLGLVFSIARQGLRIRARAVRELEEARKYSDSIVETVREPLLILSEDLHVVRANRAFYRKFAATPAGTEGRPLRELAGGSWQVPALLDRLAAVIPQHAEFDDLEVVQEIPERGRRVHLLTARELVRPGSDARLLLLAIDDVTARRAAEEERDRFFNISLDLLCIASAADGRFKQVSPTVTDMLGWTPEEFLAQPYMDLIHPDDRASSQAEVERQVRLGEKVLNFENRFRHKDGSWRILSWRSVPQPGGLMYASARDVTEHRRMDHQIRDLNAELSRRAAELEAANHELEAFSYSVSHDLRAPLRHIDGFANLLARNNRDRLDEKGRRHVDVIAGAARKLGILIDELLTFSRMGRAEMRHTPTDMRALVAEVAAEQNAAAGDRRIDWRIGPLPTVAADPAMLRQVWVNLLGNAVKYSRERAEAVIAVSHRADPRLGHVFSVRDNGAGFDMQYAGKLFGVFQRLHTDGEFEGTGVGLANVRRIVQRHGGHTWAEGAPGVGATFHFSLPGHPAVNGRNPTPP